MKLNAYGVIALLVAVIVSVQSADAQSAPPVRPNSASATGDEDTVNPDRPGIADGSRVIRPGQVQLESGLQQEYRRDADSHTRTDFVPTLLRLGISERVELRIESNFASWTSATTTDGSKNNASGLAPASLGFKYQIFDSNGEHRRSVGTIVRIFPPSGSSEFRSRRYAGDVRLAGDWDFASNLSLNPNIGVARVDDGQGGTFVAGLGAMTLNYLPTPSWNPFIDLGYQSPESANGKASLLLDGGVAYILGRNVQLDMSMGQGLRGTTPPRPFIAAGLSIRASAFRR
jgi:hypothetical protein